MTMAPHLLVGVQSAGRRGRVRRRTAAGGDPGGDGGRRADGYADPRHDGDRLVGTLGLRTQRAHRCRRQSGGVLRPVHRPNRAVRTSAGLRRLNSQSSHRTLRGSPGQSPPTGCPATPTTEPPEVRSCDGHRIIR